MPSKLRPLGPAWPVDDVAQRLQTSVDDASKRALAAWLDLLVAWNQRMDLTAARTEDELADLMLADAMILAREIPRADAAGSPSAGSAPNASTAAGQEAPHAATSVLDVGTGAGAPGLALALLRPDLAVTLVEPLVKRVSFLRFVLGSLGRTDVRIERTRSDALPDAQWDVAVARATLPPEAWLAEGVRLTKPGGHVWVLLAREENPLSPHAELASEHEYTWPRTGVARRAACYVHRHA